MYAKSIHEEALALAPNSSEIVGIAMFTMVASRAVINVPIEMEISINFSVEDITYFEDLGINAIYFNPVFSSDHHGYDTRDYRVLDERLGTNEDFKEVCQNLHSIVSFLHLSDSLFLPLHSNCL